MMEMNRILEPYGGGLIAYDRRDHASAKQLDDEIAILNGMSVAFPIVFLSIATFMTSAVLARVIRLQREQDRPVEGLRLFLRAGRLALF